MSRTYRGQAGVVIAAAHADSTTIDCKGHAGGTLVVVSGSVATITVYVQAVAGGTWGAHATTITVSSGVAVQLADYIHGAYAVRFQGNVPGVGEVGLEN